MSQEFNTLDQALHAADVEHLERRIVSMALERTGSRNGALFLWDPKRRGLTAGFQVVEGLEVSMPPLLLRPRTDGRPNGIAVHAHQTGRPYLCLDSEHDPHYAPYVLPVRSIAAVPIHYQRRPIAVLAVSAKEPHAFDATALGELEALGASAAKFLRRAQLHRSALAEGGRPLLIKGLSPQWLEVERRIEHVAGTRAAVLVQGESGTGKELVARALHFNSERSDGPFVAVNCAAIPEALLESTLFGHVRGAFTGANYEKQGDLARAHRGTLFLDELGELPLALQPKLLRALELGEVQPVGSSKPPQRVDVRLVCATHRDLEARMREGSFRDDLYYRVAVVRITVPPLRTYLDNLEVLVHVFRQQAAQRHERAVTQVTPEALARLRSYDYPGNVRELRNAIEHAVVMAPGDTIRVEDLPDHVRTARRDVLAARSPDAANPVPSNEVGRRALPLREQREAWLAPLETAYLRDLLDEERGHVRRAASIAGVDAATFYRLLEKRRVRPVRR